MIPVRMRLITAREDHHLLNTCIMLVYVDIDILWPQKPIRCKFERLQKNQSLPFLKWLKNILVRTFISKNMICKLILHAGQRMYFWLCQHVTDITSKSHLVCFVRQITRKHYQCLRSYHRNQHRQQKVCSDNRSLIKQPWRTQNKRMG